MIPSGRARASARRCAAALLLAVVGVACGQKDAAAPPPPPRWIAIIGTNDLHGNLERLPLFGGFVSIVREARATDGGGVLLIDAGDMFHGTMESNLNEGEAVMRAYNELGYTAATIGNHDFDFGPTGADDTRGDVHGALKQRARQAQFPLVTANVVDRDTGQPIAWENVTPSTMVAVGDVRVGIIGVATEDLARVVRPSHFGDLQTTDMSAAVAYEAKLLRARGVPLVIVAAHAGGRCAEFVDPRDLSTCDLEGGEVFELARELDPGLVDVIIAGHNHSGIAHIVNDIAIVEAYSHGRAFSRVDVLVDRGRVSALNVYPPRELCLPSSDPLRCDPGRYESLQVVPDQRVAEVIAADVAAARTLNEEQLGVTVLGRLWRSQTAESPLGNLFVDLMLATRPDADIALQNGGALRDDIPPGELDFGHLYRAMSFDNHFANISVQVGVLERELARSLATSTDVFSIAGARAVARCEGGRLALDLVAADGTPLADDATLRVLVSDYLATGGDGMFSPETLRRAKVSFPRGPLIRDAMAQQLRQRGDGIDPNALYDERHPRVLLPATPPITCGE